MQEKNQAGEPKDLEDFLKKKPRKKKRTEWKKSAQGKQTN